MKPISLAVLDNENSNGAKPTGAHIDPFAPSGPATPNNVVVKTPYRLSNGNLEYRERHEDDEGVISYKWVSVCSDLRVVAMTKDVNGEEWGRLLLLTTGNVC